MDKLNWVDVLLSDMNYKTYKRRADMVAQSQNKVKELEKQNQEEVKALDRFTA